jgi:SAM-dependent methyltransferase
MARYDDVVDDLRAAYDRGAARRETLTPPPWRLAERRAFLDRVRDAGGRRLLELGAGPGHDSAYFAEAGLEVVATDVSPAMVEFCRAKGLDARVADVFALDFPPAAFDAIYTVNCLLHVPDADLPAVLANLALLLRHKGLMYLGVWGGRDHEGTLDEDDHTPRRFFALRTDERIQEYASRYFAIIDFHTVTSEDGHHFQSLTLGAAHSVVIDGAAHEA